MATNYRTPSRMPEAKVLAILIILITIMMLLFSSCQSCSESGRRAQAVYYKAVILSSSYTSTLDNNYQAKSIVYRCKDLERGVIVIKSFPLVSLNSLYEKGDTIMLMR